MVSTRMLLSSHYLHDYSDFLSPQEYTLPSYYGKLILNNHSQSREMLVKKTISTTYLESPV